MPVTQKYTSLCPISSYAELPRCSMRGRGCTMHIVVSANRSLGDTAPHTSNGQANCLICSLCSTMTMMGSILIYRTSSSTQDEESCLTSLSEHPRSGWKKSQRWVVSHYSSLTGELGSSPYWRAKHLENPISPAPLLMSFGSKGFITRISRFLALLSRKILREYLFGTAQIEMVV